MMTRVLAASLLALVAASDARAQIDLPSFMPPRPGDDIGVYVSDVGAAEYQIQGIWRQQGNMNLGVRLGYMDIGPEGALVVGAETWGLLFAAGAELPVDVAWTLAGGAAFNGGTVFGLPVGLTIGRVLELESLRVQLYGHPRLATVFSSGGDADLDIDIEPLFDVGVDTGIGENLTLRLGATLGGTDAIGIGVAYHWTRGAVVR